MRRLQSKHEGQRSEPHKNQRSGLRPAQIPKSIESFDTVLPQPPILATSISHLGSVPIQRSKDDQMTYRLFVVNFMLVPLVQSSLVD